MLFSTMSTGLGQVQNAQIEKIRYSEINLGLAKTYDLVDYGLGLSYLRGETYIFKNNFIFEWEIGMALPTLATGKLGFGLRINKINYTIGIRPYPSTTYFQVGFPGSKNRILLISFEYNPRKEFTNFSGLSNGNINIGYRFSRE